MKKDRITGTEWEERLVSDGGRDYDYVGSI